MATETRTVLIVDDDPQMLRLLEKMLRPRNVNVLVAPGPAGALQICEQETVHLLISDLAMPELDGSRLAERVIRLQPEVLVLLISGEYLDPPALTRCANVRFLKKPFFPSELLRHLREL